MGPLLYYKITRAGQPTFWNFRLSHHKDVISKEGKLRKLMLCTVLAKMMIEGFFSSSSNQGRFKWQRSYVIQSSQNASAIGVLANFKS